MEDSIDSALGRGLSTIEGAALGYDRVPSRTGSHRVLPVVELDGLMNHDTRQKENAEFKTVLCSVLVY